MKDKDKAYCGDGILRLCLGEIFLSGGGRQEEHRPFVNQLQSNKILAKVVFFNEAIFRKGHLIHIRNEWTLGTAYEKHLYDLFKEEGIAACIKFVITTFEISNPGIETADITYLRWATRKLKHKIPHHA